MALRGAPEQRIEDALEGSKRKPGRPSAHQGCQVCGCDLAQFRLFHQRYHICTEHMMAPEVLFKGAVQRFCQQCGRFHELSRFAPNMRSCRQQLARHAERRRRGRAAAAATAANKAAAASLAQKRQRLLQQQREKLTGTASAEALVVKMEQGEGCKPALLCSKLPPNTPSKQPERGSGGSEQSAHSTHQQAGVSSRPASPLSGMEALLAAAEEEEVALQAEQHVSKRAKLTPSPSPSPLSPPTAAQNVSWFQSPAGAAAGAVPPSSACARPSEALESGAHSFKQGAWPAPDAASAVLPRTPALLSILSIPTPEPCGSRPDLTQLLQQLLAAPPAMQRPLLQPLDSTAGAPALLAALGPFADVMRLAQQEQQQQQQHSEQAGQLQRLLAHSMHERGQQGSGMLQAAINGIVSGLLGGLQQSCRT